MTLFFSPTQENAINLLSNTASFMASQKNANPELLQKVGASLLHGIGNLMTASSSEAKVADTDKRKPNKKKDTKKEKVMPKW